MSARSRVERAPAKLNLGLRIVGRRSDGYHLLDSVFVPLDLADEVEVALEPAPGTREVSLALEGGPADLPAGAENLAARAAHAFLDAAGLDARVRIRLAKRIPVGAGLGGGSSDAAAVLRALVRLAADLGVRVPAATLAARALRLGADVPYFLDPRPARVTGIGEEVEPLAGVPPYGVLLVTPSPGLATAEVYRAWDEAPPDPLPAGSHALTLAEPGRKLTRLPGSFAEASAGPGALRLLDVLVLDNDLEAVARRLRPAIGRVRAELEKTGASGVGMSGSGPTVFGLFADAGSAREAASRGRWEETDRIHAGRSLGSSDAEPPR